MTRVVRGSLPPSSYTEREWQHQVEELADMYGWDYRFHIGRTKYAPWGWPDLVLVRRRDRRIVFAELKTQDGKPSPDQVGLLELLLDVAGGGFIGPLGEIRPSFPVASMFRGDARVDVELWRPGDIDRVMAVLA